MNESRPFRIALTSLLIITLCLASVAPALHAQTAFATDPAAALADALLAACRQDPAVFATHLTAQSSAAYLALPADQRVDLLKRFVLLDDPGKPLLATDENGHNVIRCEAGGVLSELRFGATEVHDNLAFIPVTVPQAGEQEQSARFGLVREDGKWKLLSLGLLLLDVPSLARDWVQQELESRESKAAQSLGKISDALNSYLQAFGSLPEMLSQLGPPSADDHGKSPEKAGLLDADLASGEYGGYRFRYNIAPQPGGADESSQTASDGFQLAATPIQYGKDGEKSFYLDATGKLRGGDKGGAVATADDPVIGATQPAQP
jgi:hypothetical protein